MLSFNSAKLYQTPWWIGFTRHALGWHVLLVWPACGCSDRAKRSGPPLWKHDMQYAGRMNISGVGHNIFTTGGSMEVQKNALRHLFWWLGWRNRTFESHIWKRMSTAQWSICHYSWGRTCLLRQILYIGDAGINCFRSPVSSHSFLFAPLIWINWETRL